MAKAFLKLDARRALKDGTYMVRIGVGYGTNMYISTGVSVDKTDWDDRAMLYTGKGAKRINDTLAGILARVNVRILELRESGKFSQLTKEQLKLTLSKIDIDVDDLMAESSPTLADIFEKVIATKNKRNGQLYAETLKKLAAWCDVASVNFDQITKMWLTEFYSSMGGLSINTKAIHMRNLRNVINCAIDENITTNYPFRNYRIPREETEMRVIPIETMRGYVAAEGLSKFNAEHRDMFMLIFYLVGINIVDLSKLTADNLINGRIEYRRSKTGKLYSIKVEPEALAIIEKYKGAKYLLQCFDRYENYKDYAQHLNNAMRKLDKSNNKVSTYWARYSWATYAAELEISKDTISEALGHEYGSRITGVYIKFSRDKIDKANRKVIDYLLKK
ncbi:MAG: site-specific integrase [Rikenellaceae bacterium]